MYPHIGSPLSRAFFMSQQQQQRKPRKFHSSPTHYLWMFCCSHKRIFLRSNCIRLNYCCCQCRIGLELSLRTYAMKVESSAKLRCHKPLAQLHNLITFIAHHAHLNVRGHRKGATRNWRKMQRKETIFNLILLKSVTRANFHNSTCSRIHELGIRIIIFWEARHEAFQSLANHKNVFLMLIFRFPQLRSIFRNYYRLLLAFSSLDFALPSLS